MSCAYVILAHKAPEQIGRLLQRLAPSAVFLHVDANTDEATFRAIRECLPGRDNVELLPRRPISWAGWSQVDATLAGLRAAVRAGADHVVTLSGQDYPLRSAPAIEHFLAAGDASFVSHWALPAPWFEGRGGLRRVRYWTATVANRRVAIPIPRPMPAGLRPFGGSAFLSLSRAVAAYVCHVADLRRDVVRFYQHTWLPAEMFLQTVIANSPYRDAVINESLWHIEWPPERGKHPRLLTSEALPRLIASAHGPSELGGYGRRKLFARKFDLSVDSEVLDCIDAELIEPSALT